MRPPILNYTYPTLSTGKVWFISFMFFDESKFCMRRKRIKLQHIKDTKQRKRYALIMIHKIMDKLDQGWNPWKQSLDETHSKHPLDEIEKNYLSFISFQQDEGLLRPDSTKSYRSYLSVLSNWLRFSDQKFTFIEDLTKSTFVEFLDYIYITKKNSSTTRNNYLVWLVNFCGWCKEHGYMLENLAEGIKHLPKAKVKNRSTLSDQQLKELHDYCMQHNRSFLLVAQLIFYCFIRPKELSYLRIGDINLKEGLLKISGDISKNGKCASITLPIKVIHTMLDLEIFNYPSSYFIFSSNFEPGSNYLPPKRMSDFWFYHVRPDLKFSQNIKLYSLKDTGITHRLHDTDSLSVRDQARHSDISITNIYAEKTSTASEKFKLLDDIL